MEKIPVELVRENEGEPPHHVALHAAESSTMSILAKESSHTQL